MICKPDSAPEFNQGDSIYAVDGLAAFLTWMCAFVFNLSDQPANGPVQIDMTVPTEPKFEVRYI